MRVILHLVDVFVQVKKGARGQTSGKLLGCIIVEDQTSSRLVFGHI